MTEKNSITTRTVKRREKEQYYDYLEESGRMMEHKLSEKPYILQAVQQDERLKGNGVKNEKRTGN